VERTILAALLASAALSAGALAAEPEGKTPNPAKPALARLQPGDLERWGRPQMVFTGKLEKVVAGPWACPTRRSTRSRCT
jgi:hypothetical protein